MSSTMPHIAGRYSTTVELTASRVTDLYLLALALRHEAHLVTFDRRIPANALRGGAAALRVLEA